MPLDCKIAFEQKLAQKEVYPIEDEDRAYPLENECKERDKESGCIRLLVSFVHARVGVGVDAHVEAHARVGVEDESTGIIEEKVHKTLKQNQSQKEKEEAAKDDTVLPIEPAEREGAKVFP